MTLPFKAFLIQTKEVVDIVSVTDSSAGRVYWYKGADGELISATAEEVDLEVGF